MAQQEALWELVVTEKEHIEKLALMGEVQERLSTLNASGLLLDVSPTLLLRNIRELERANRSFWAAAVAPMLAHSRMSRGPLKPALLEPGFDAMPAWAAPYTDFCLHHLVMDFYIMKSLKGVELFREWMGWIEAQGSMRRLHLKDLLAAPMQRLTKYPLLLKAVLKNTTEDEDLTSLRLMIQRASETATRLNVEFSNKNNLETLRHISATIDSYDAVETANEELERAVRRVGTKLDLSLPMPLCGPRAMRRIVHKGELKLRDALGKADVLCLLFTDMMLVCKAEKTRKASIGQPRLRVVRPPYHIQSIRVARLLESREGGFSFVYLNEFGLPSAAFSFTANSQDDAGRWVEAFENALKEFHHARSLADVWSANSAAVSSVNGLQPPRSEADMAERRMRRRSVGNVLLDHHRAMSLKPTSTSADDPSSGLLVAPGPPGPGEPPIHRKSSSMDSTTVHASASTGHLLDLPNPVPPPSVPPVHSPTAPQLLDDESVTDNRRSRSISSDVLSKIRSSMRSSVSRSPSGDKSERSSRSPSPRQSSKSPSFDSDQSDNLLARQISASSTSGTMSPGQGSSETLVPGSAELEPPTFRPRLPSPISPGRRPVLKHQAEAETESDTPPESANSPSAETDKPPPTEEAEEDGVVPELVETTESAAQFGDPGSGEKNRRFEKRYHTADGIEAFKPKSTTYPAGILKRFSWNITSAISNGGNGGKKSGKGGGMRSANGGSSEWRKASTMSSDSFCSSSGVSSSSSQLAVNDEPLDPPTPVPTTLPPLLGDPPKSHVSTICVNEAASGGLGSEGSLRISLAEEVPKIRTQAPTPPMGRTPSASLDEGCGKAGAPNRDDLLKLIMEGQLETS